MLAAIADEEPVDETLATFARENRMHVVADQRAADQHRVRGDVCVAALMNP